MTQFAFIVIESPSCPGDAPAPVVNVFESEQKNVSLDMLAERALIDDHKKKNPTPEDIKRMKETIREEKEDELVQMGRNFIRWDQEEAIVVLKKL